MAIRSSSLPSIIRVTLLLVVQTMALVALLRAGEVPGLAFPTGNLGQWLVTTPPEQAVMVTLRMVGLVGAGWMLTSSLLYLVARAAGFPRALRAVNWLTLPVMRRAVDRALALSVATSTVMGGGIPAYASEAAAPPPPALAPPALLYTPGEDPAEEADDAEDAQGEEAQEVPAPRPSPIPEPRDLVRDDGDDPPSDPDGSDQGDDEPSEPPEDDGDDESPEEQPEDEPSDEPPADAPSVHTVQAGESLWTIAEAHAGADGNDAIAAYWVALLEANPDLASEDPDLIHPGDQITLPQS